MHGKVQVSYTHAQTTIRGKQNVSCMIVYANMLFDAQKSVYPDF